jgi:hypothetical protein
MPAPNIIGVVVCMVFGMVGEGAVIGTDHEVVRDVDIGFDTGAVSSVDKWGVHEVGVRLHAAQWMVLTIEETVIQGSDFVRGLYMVPTIRELVMSGLELMSSSGRVSGGDLLNSQLCACLYGRSCCPNRDAPIIVTICCCHRREKSRLYAQL